MKNIDFKQYGMGVISFILGVFLFNIVQGNNSFIGIFIGVVASIGLFNISSIFLYKTLKTERESPKFIFSFLNIITLSVIILTTVFS